MRTIEKVIELYRNDQGGISPQIPYRARRVDLITFPEGITGANCANCRYYNQTSKSDIGYCNNRAIHQYVNKRMCCALWDAPGTLREF